MKYNLSLTTSLGATNDTPIRELQNLLGSYKEIEIYLLESSFYTSPVSQSEKCWWNHFR